MTHKVWRLNAREDIWSPSKIPKEKLPKDVRELQRQFLAGELTFSEYSTLMDQAKEIHE